MTDGAKRERISRRNRRGVALFFLLLFFVALYLACRDYQGTKRAEERFEELATDRRQVVELVPDQKRSKQTEQEGQEGQKEGERGSGSVPQNQPEEENPDFLGWLEIKDTTISYPVMQKAGDAEYYLHRDFDGNYSFYGTPFLDIRCTPESDNCIIYGHNINGRRMFGALHAYSEEEYYREHPEIELRMGGELREYRVLSVISTTIDSPVYSFTDAGNWQEYREYVETILSGSSYRTEMAGQVEEELAADTKEQFFRKYQFLTLSTCRSWAGKDARWMVVAARRMKNDDPDE